MTLREQAESIISAAIEASLPYENVKRYLEKKAFSRGRIVPVAVGKAAWQMACAAKDVLGDRLDRGIVITKYGHAEGEIVGMTVFEAGHPYPDENGFAAAEKALSLTEKLSENDTVLLLLSGGGSALFEKPLVDGEELRNITDQLLKSGADIGEINAVRKRLSAVKGGKFAVHCHPAKVCCVILSDVLGDRVDTIASGPASADSSTSAEVLSIAKKYGLSLSDKVRELLRVETPKEITNAENIIIGNVSTLCRAAAEKCRDLGYDAVILTERLNVEARKAGEYLADIARENAGRGKKLAFIAGGETVVKVTGSGAGGRNQEVALSAAAGIAGLQNTAVFSVGSDGTDGVTNAAGGFSDGETAIVLKKLGVDIPSVLSDNDSYNALEKCGGLIITGATGTNVNDLAAVLIEE